MDPESARQILKIQIRSIQTGVNEWRDRARDIDKAFSHWLLSSRELYLAYVAESGSSAAAIAQTIFDKQKNTDSDTKIAKDLAIGGFKKALGRFVNFERRC